jgi:uroporphyrin-III C-methyltransferase / precorrin-2 dehydrogenase / sirohydrochlorin ferrochelatase
VDVKGHVSLVGAGPGDPGLLTRRAIARLRSADLVLYDALVDPRVLKYARRAQRFYVGKRASRHAMTQDAINALMIRAARRGRRVVRLKGGDPFVFGRGAEEAIALTMAGIPVEVVPGVTTAVAAPELVGIPLTHRGIASGFLVVAGQSGDTLERAIGSVRANSITLVVMMGLAVRQEITSLLVAHGWTPETSAAIVCGVSTPDEWMWTGRLADLGSAEPPSGVAGVLVIGEVVRVRDAMTDAVQPRSGDKVKYGRS